MGSVKRAIRNQIRHLPGEGRALVGAYRQLVLLKKMAGTKLKALRDSGPDPEKVYWIDPARIVYHTNYQRPGENRPPEDRVFQTETHRGTVQGGSWDQGRFRFDDLEISRAIRARVSEGTPWPQTTFYRNLLAQIRQGIPAPWRLQSQADLDARCAYIDRLIESVRTHGYRLAHEVELQGEAKWLKGHPQFGSEITVNIGRDGQYLFQDGRHRLAIARALGIPRVPVKVLVRHTQWMQFRQFMQAMARDSAGSSRAGELYQNPLHPDLQDIPAAHSCDDRFDAMRAHVDAAGGSLLDVGANLGFFCHRFEELGYDCFAVEHMPQLARAAERLRTAEGRRFSVICEDLFAASERPPLAGRHFSLVLGLSIFHHFLKRREAFERFRAWLGRLDADAMFFEPHRFDEPQMIGAYANYDEQEFVDFILAHSQLSRAELIHRCPDGRPIYKLWRA